MGFPKDKTLTSKSMFVSKVQEEKVQEPQTAKNWCQKQKCLVYKMKELIKGNIWLIN
jgi:hypothetical protein